MVKGAPDLEYRDVAKVIDIAIGVDPDHMKIRLMTPAIESGFKQDSCMISMSIAPFASAVDPFKARNSKEMSKAAAECAVIVRVTRDGELYLSPFFSHEATFLPRPSTATTPERLPRQVRDLLAKATKENKNVVYVEADMRTKYHNVEDLADNLCGSGIEKIVLLAESGGSNGLGPRGGSNGPGPGVAYGVGGGVSAPVPIYKPNPEYSREASKAKFQGDVILSVVVDEKGNPRELKVVRPLGMGLDEKAIEAAQKWKFRPGMKDGHPVPVKAAIIINFRLR